MTEMNETKAKVTLSEIGSPDTIEILPGLVFEDKLRIKTQRRLEKQWMLPMSRIFKGQSTSPDPDDEKKTITEAWPGVDFEFLDNLIPLMTILGKQVNLDLTQEDVEGMFDDLNIPLSDITNNLKTFFERMRDRLLKDNETLKNE